MAPQDWITAPTVACSFLHPLRAPLAPCSSCPLAPLASPPTPLVRPRPKLWPKQNSKGSNAHRHTLNSITLSFARHALLATALHPFPTPSPTFTSTRMARAATNTSSAASSQTGIGPPNRCHAPTPGEFPISSPYPDYLLFLTAQSLLCPDPRDENVLQLSKKVVHASNRQNLDWANETARRSPP